MQTETGATGLQTFRNMQTDGNHLHTVTEDAVVLHSRGDGYNFINTHQPETTEITEPRPGDSTNNQDGKRPENITVIHFLQMVQKTRQAVTAD